MKNILYIDNFSTDGHINFNKIYLKELLNSQINLTCSFRYGYSVKLGLERRITNILDIPDKLYSNNDNSFVNRFYLIKQLSFVREKLDFSKFDIVIVGAYDCIALYFSFISTKLILVNHNNLSDLENSVKLFFYKKISRNNIQLVFEDYMKQYLYSKGIMDVVHINHGLPERWNIEELSLSDAKNNLNFREYSTIIFAPSSSSSDEVFFRGLIENNLFLNFLKTNKILFILKGKYEIDDISNVKIIDYYLTDLEYKNIFLLSDIILVKYPKSFKYRTSAVFLECVANNKICLLSNIDAFLCLSDKMNYDPYFGSIDELIFKIMKTIDHPILEPYLNKDKFNVDLNVL